MNNESQLTLVVDCLEASDTSRIAGCRPREREVAPDR